MIQILYGHKHDQRAMNLAGALGNARHDDINRAPTKVPGLDTLLFWGHGDAWKLCEQTPDQMAAIITKWKAKNSGLKTIEIVTCNARHSTAGMEPFAQALKAKLRAGFMSATRNVKVKGLPITVTGSANAFSVLLADPGTNTWAYVTGPGTDDSVMWEGARLINSHVVNGRRVDFKGNIAARANQIVNDPANAGRKWTVNYGSFRTLRDHLVKV